MRIKADQLKHLVNMMIRISHALVYPALLVSLTSCSFRYHIHGHSQKTMKPNPPNITMRVGETKKIASQPMIRLMVPSPLSRVVQTTDESIVSVEISANGKKAYLKAHREGKVKLYYWNRNYVHNRKLNDTPDNKGFYVTVHRKKT